MLDWLSSASNTGGRPSVLGSIPSDLDAVQRSASSGVDNTAPPAAYTVERKAEAALAVVRQGTDTGRPAGVDTDRPFQRIQRFEEQMKVGRRPERAAAVGWTAPGELQEAVPYMWIEPTVARLQ